MTDLDYFCLILRLRLWCVRQKNVIYHHRELQNLKTRGFVCLLLMLFIRLEQWWWSVFSDIFNLVLFILLLFYSIHTYSFFLNFIKLILKWCFSLKRGRQAFPISILGVNINRYVHSWYFSWKLISYWKKR